MWWMITLICGSDYLSKSDCGSVRTQSAVIHPAIRQFQHEEHLTFYLDADNYREQLAGHCDMNILLSSDAVNVTILVNF